jgi:hypothetical protein
MWRPFWGKSVKVSDKDRVKCLKDEAEALREELKVVEGELEKLKK